MLRYTITFTGRVQGVFFRATARDIASGHDVSGWVRNEAGGTVGCIVEGEEEELRRFVAAVELARRGSIAETRITEGSATGEFEGFQIRY